MCLIVRPLKIRRTAPVFILRRKYAEKIYRYVSLSTLGLTAISCYILADTFFVSKGMGVVGLTALNLAIPVSQLSTGIVMIVFNFIIIRIAGNVGVGV